MECCMTLTASVAAEHIEVRARVRAEKCQSLACTSLSSTSCVRTVTVNTEYL